MDKETNNLDQVPDPKPYKMKSEKYFHALFFVIIVALPFTKSLGLPAVASYVPILIAFMGEMFIKLYHAKKSGNPNYPKAMVLHLIATSMVVLAFLSTIFLSKNVYAPMCFFSFFLIFILSTISMFLVLPKENSKMRPFFQFLLIVLVICILIAMLCGLRALIMGEFV